MSNPYNRFIELMRKEGSAYNPPSIMFAEVVRGLPDVIIQLGDIQLDKDNLMLTEAFRASGAYIGDTVLVIPTNDKQTFIIIDKVVKA